jgi:DNA-binding SARP family transcriptional activator
MVEAAISLDPYSDDTTQRAMRIVARVGHLAAVDTLLNRLRAALYDIGEEPSPATVALAADLRRPPRHLGPATDGDRP